MKLSKFFIIFILCINFVFIGYSEGDFDKTLTDITIESTNRYINENKTTSFTSTEGLEFIFAGENYFDTIDSEKDMFGIIEYDKKRISINVELIHNNSLELNLTDEEFYVKVQNTIMHEIGHYIDHYNRIPNFRDIHNVTEINEVLQNKQYFLDIYTEDVLNDYGNESVPYFLEGTVNFEPLYDGEWNYSSEDYAEETLVRIFALCWLEDDNYDYYWQMLELQEDRKLCQNFDYPVYFDNNLNEIGRELIEGYINTYESQYRYEETNFFLTTSIDFMGTFIAEFTNFLIENYIPLMIVAMILFAILVIIQYIQNYLWDILKKYVK